MAKRDPFGRLPDENPLEFLGRPSNGTSEVAQAEAASAEEASSAPRPSAPPPVRRPRVPDFVGTRTASTFKPAQVRRITGRVIRTVVGAWVLLSAFVLLLGLVLFGSHSDTGGSSAVTVSKGAAPPASVPRRSAPPPAGRPSAPPPPPAARPAAAPRGLNASSLLTRRKLGPALRRLGTSGLGRLRSLAIRPERVDAQLLTRGGRLRSVQLRSDGTLSDFGTSGAGFGQLETIAFARVQAGAPERLARSAAERLHRPASQVDYVVLLQLGTVLSWSVFMRDGKHFLADSRGRITRRIS